MATVVVSPDEQTEYLSRYEDAVRKEEKVPVLLADGREVGWAPQPGSQEAFLSCPVFEVLYEGTRGPGKTDALLMSFAMHVGKGHGAAWRGVLFRQTYPQLADVVAKSKKWFYLIFGKNVQFNEASMTWKWSTGEQLLLRHMKSPSDYWNYHGHEYPWIGWEELTNWANDECYRKMFACCRSSQPGMPRMVRATTNPYGVGHAWVKARFQLPAMREQVITDATDLSGRPEPPRVAVHGHIMENRILLDADPDYPTTLAGSARNEAERLAWMEGSWDIVAGGMFDDIWLTHKEAIVVEPILKFIPSSWMIDRSFDWGSSRPFSVGWWAESDGTDLVLPDGSRRSTVRGDIFRIAEWYGWTGRPNEGLRTTNTAIAKGIVQREVKMGFRPGPKKCRVRAGPADSSIFDEVNGSSVAVEMAQSVRLAGKRYRGVTWLAADKSAGSRIQGWQRMRDMFAATLPEEGRTIRERPGMFICSNCDQFLRTVPVLPRDELDPDDVDTDAEDHTGDDARYRARRRSAKVKKGHARGALV